MALRAKESHENAAKVGSSAVAGLHPYWSDTQKKPSVECRKWSDFFAVAMTAEYSILMSEVLRNVTNEADRNKALLNNLDHAVAERKCVSVMYLSLGYAARKTFMDKYPAANIAEISLQELMENCKATFDVKRNRTLDRFRFLSREQMPAETLEQFWHFLNGMTTECDFGGQTESLVHDIFILYLRNLAAQEKLCTEPRNSPKEALDFAIAFQEGSLREHKVERKAEPMYTVYKKKDCLRCGMEKNFTMDHLEVCRAK